jgi:dTDP-4-dehydrorhamnose reductase
MRVMVVGARGLLGAAITREFSPDCDVRAFGRPDLELTDQAAVARTVDRVQPDVLINCAAFSGVDLAEDQPERALAVNAFAVLSLARAAASRQCAFFHYSTDFVFDGETDRPYTEDDEPNPRSFYGLSKLLGEWFAAEQERAYVLRVESLFGEAAAGEPPKGSLHAIVTRIMSGDEVPVFVDRTVSPTYTVDVARATRAMIDAAPASGLYHCVNSGAATWAAVAEEAARLLDRPLKVRELTLESANLKAPRPRYCALSNAKLGAAFVMPTWQDGLRRHLSGPVNRGSRRPAL